MSYRYEVSMSYRYEVSYNIITSIKSHMCYMVFFTLPIFLSVVTIVKSIKPQRDHLLDRLWEVNKLNSAQVRIIVSSSVYGEAPKRQLHSAPIAVSGNAYTGN